MIHSNPHFAAARMVAWLCAASMTLGAGCTTPECDDESKLCNGVCVLKTNPADQCGSGGTCVRCPEVAVPNASRACINNACAWACNGLRGDCNHEVSDGCETSLAGDSLNCGGCGVVCHGDCVDGVCTVRVAEAEPAPSGLVLAATALYWTSFDGTRLSVRTSDRNASVRTLASVDAHPGIAAALALDADEVFWTTGGTDQPGAADGAVYRLTLPAGSPTLVAGSQGAPAGIALSPDAIYWTNHASGEVMRAARAEGVAKAIATNQVHPRGIAFGGGRVYWVNEGSGASDGAVVMAGSDGSQPVVISTDAALPDGTVVPTGMAPGPLSAFVPAASGGAAGPFFPAIFWADRIHNVVWAVQPSGGVPFPVSFPLVPWDPLQLSGIPYELIVVDRAAQSIEELQDVILVRTPGGTSFPPSHLFARMTIPDPVALAPGVNGVDSEFAWISGTAVRWRLPPVFGPTR